MRVRVFGRTLIVALLALMVAALPRVAAAETPAQQLSALAARVDAAVAKLDAGDVEGARTEYKAFDDGWFEIEDGIRDQSRTSYRAIEGAMGDVKYALRAEPVNADQARTALRKLREQCDAFVGGPAGTQPQPAGEAGGALTLPALR